MICETLKIKQPNFKVINTVENVQMFKEMAGRKVHANAYETFKKSTISDSFVNWQLCK